MSREGMLLFGAVVAAAAVVVLASPLSPIALTTGTGGYDDLTWSPNKPQAHHDRGGLFHPPLCGQGRTGLIMYGYDWIINPPGEAQVGVGQVGLS